MDDLSRTLAELREEPTPAWSDAHADRLLAGIGQLRKRRRLHRIVGSAAFGAAFVGAVIVLRHNPREVGDADGVALMEAADAARSSGQPKLAVEYLRRVLRDHRTSSVAPLAGFTLGRVLLESLGQPSEAAEAFAAVRDIAPRGSLAEDALAREVEALSKAGHSREAYERAQLYAQSYPAGRRLRPVRLFGGLP